MKDIYKHQRSIDLDNTYLKTNNNTITTTTHELKQHTKTLLKKRGIVSVKK